MTKPDVATGLEQPAKPHPISLSGTLDIKDAVKLCGRLRAAIDEGGPVHIDLTDVSGLDISIVQLLVSAQRSAARSGNDFLLTSAPDGPLAQVMATAGLSGLDGRVHDECDVAQLEKPNNLREYQ